mgnify:CR=1 FL=1|jgi:hypothetical protein
MMRKDIYKQLMAVSELFGGYAVKDAEDAHETELGDRHSQWLEGRASAYRLVEDHCKRMAAIYKEEE